MRFRVIDGHTLVRGAATYAAGEEFEATGEEARALLDGGQVTRVDKPKPRQVRKGSK